ncbi:universal stress protein [Nocardioides ginsengisoli]|uniref:Universal stress protein n=1 Tax=Nocardioides ginsengisoli TaxID=363868 RepID=A0ABW3W632_9ACTN
MTTEQIDPGSIVVGADGSEDGDRALRWAAEQAFLERRPLTIVTATGSPGVPVVTPDLVDHARAVAEAARAVAEHLHPGLDVATAVRVGDARQVLVDLSRRVHLIVLGSRGRGVFRSTVLGSVSAAVSRDAACPVVVCRPERRRTGEPYRGVLVGADGTAESLPVIEFAFQQASLHRLPLTVVHAMWDELATAHLPVEVSADTQGLEEQRLLLAESVAGMASKFPEVSVEQLLARGLPEECLAADSSAWDLVVVGRHPVDTVLRLLSGAVATTVVERARTVVAVVPQSDPSPDPTSRS